MSQPDIAKLILLLGSPHDGEVIAAARALVRALKQQGMDLHDFAAITESMAAFNTTDPARLKQLINRLQARWDDLRTEEVIARMAAARAKETVE